MKARYKILFFLIIVMNILITQTNAVEIISEKEGNKTVERFTDISAPNIMLAEIKSGKILYEKNIDENIYPASITKLMTAILTVENCELDEIVTISENAVISVPSGYVNANLQVGEELTVEDLLYVTLIPSANDAANALAEHVGGSIESFAAMMNARAKELGCTKTNFTNPSGLHEENHYTTTRDIYYISKEAISKDIIKKIISTTNYTLPQTNKYTATPRMFTTTNYMKRKNLSKYYCDYCIGGKTGYTEYAKNCVVEFAQKDEIELIAIVMGEESKIKGQKFLDAKELFNYAYNNYKVKKVATHEEIYETKKILNATKETRMLDIEYQDDINILVEKENYENIELINVYESTQEKNIINKKVEYFSTKAPIAKGDKIGKITYEYQGIKYETNLIAKSNVDEASTMSIIIKIILITLILYIIYILKKSNRNRKKHGKKLYK